MQIRMRLAVVALFVLVAPAHADPGESQGFGPCKDGYSDGTVVRTESRGEMAIGEVRVNDRVWSFNQGVGRPGWSQVLKRVDGGQHYMLLSDFTEPGSSVVTRACWRIRRAS